MCTKKLVALSFDDGPSDLTLAILRLLAQHDARATFFMLGEHVRFHAGVAHGVLRRGHEIGNHGWSHHGLSKLSDDRVVKEFEETRREIERTLGVTPRLARAPWGVHHPRLAKLLADTPTGAVVGWSLASNDWRRRWSAEQIADHVLGELHPGAIVLFHDGRGAGSRGRRDRQITAEVLRLLLPQLEICGYLPVTVSKLLAADPAPAMCHPIYNCEARGRSAQL